MKILVSLFGAMLLLSSATASCAEGYREQYVLGLKLAKAGNYHSAAGIFLRLAETHPTDPAVQYNLGNCLFHLGELAEAAAAYNRAIALNRDDADAHYNQAITLSMMGEMDRALESLEQVVRIRPEDGEAHYQLASGYASMEMWEKAALHARLAKKAGHPVPSALSVVLEKRAPARQDHESYAQYRRIQKTP